MALALGAGWGISAGEVLIKDGEKLAFLGDSITEQGNKYPCGYLNLVMDGLGRAGVKAVKIPAGVSGNRSCDMLARLDKVLAQKPDVLTLSCGVNDVWHFDWNKGVPLEDYKANVTQIVDKATAAGVRVVVFTATMIQENPENDKNAKLAPYNEFLRAFAKERSLPLVELNGAMQAAVKEAAGKPSGITFDGVHMTQKGNIMIATNVLRVLGVPEEKIAEAAAEWASYPASTRLVLDFTVEEWRALDAMAKRLHKDLNAEFLKTVVLPVKDGAQGGEGEKETGR